MRARITGQGVSRSDSEIAQKSWPSGAPAREAAACIALIPGATVISIADQSIGTPLIGMAQDGLAAFEPAFVDELAVIVAFAFAHIQKDGGNDASERNWLRDESGGSVYLRLSTRPIEQLQRAMTSELRHDIVDGGYWLRPPGPNCQVVVAYAGAVAPEAIQAVGLIAEDRRDVGLLAVTSADRLNAGWTAAQRARERGLVHARSHIERLLAEIPSHCGIVTVLDGHPATLAFLSYGVQPPTPDWGLNIAEQYQNVSFAWWESIFPALAIASLIVAVNLIADAVQQVLEG